ncbi:MAG: hypothetical protein M9910_03530 [Kiritimatiellae bacterium]|nr:hypothetical protein [Kiritimatiellia bacterium]
MIATNTKFRRTSIAVIIFGAILLFSLYFRQCGPQGAGFYALVHQRGGLQYVVLLLSAYGLAALFCPIGDRSNIFSVRHSTAILYLIAGFVSLSSSLIGYIVMSRSPDFASWTAQQKNNALFVTLDPILLWILLVFGMFISVGARKIVTTCLEFSKSRHEHQ